MDGDLTEWDDPIETTVDRARALKEEGTSPSTVAKGLLALKVLGCNFGTTESKGKEYLRARWFGKGKRKKGKVRRPDGQENEEMFGGSGILPSGHQRIGADIPKIPTGRPPRPVI